jgi:hypothetical protein
MEKRPVLVTSMGRLRKIICEPNWNEMSEKNTASMFTKDNYRWMMIGLAVIALGMVLMAGARAIQILLFFNKDAVYSPLRITVAPLLILLGLGIEVVAIFKKPKTA